jgi:hypothetical protein
LDILKEKEISKRENEDNFTKKEVVEKAKDENFINAVYLRY